MAIILTKRAQCPKCMESDTFDFTDPKTGFKTKLCRKCDKVYIRNEKINDFSNTDGAMVRVEVYNGTPVTVTFKRMGPRRIQWTPPGWEEKDFIVCAAGKFCNLPHQYYTAHFSDEKYIPKHGELIFNYGDQIGIKNTLPSRPEAKTTRFLST